MSFAINFLDELPNHQVLGELKIGDFKEKTRISTKYWSKKQYIQQWIDGLNKILKTNDAKSVLCLEIDPSNSNNLVDYWILYRDGDTVYIQNTLVPLSEIKQPISSENLLDKIDKIPERDDGVSEWRTTVDELKEWLNKLRVDLQKVS